MLVGRRFSTFALLFALSACASQTAPNAGGSAISKAVENDADRAATAIADELVEQAFIESPEIPTRLRMPGYTYDRLGADSLADIAARNARRDAMLEELKRIDRGALKSESAKLAYDLALDALTRFEGVRVCRYELWARLSQMIAGWQFKLSGLAEMQPVGTEALRAQA